MIPQQALSLLLLTTHSPHQFFSQWNKVSLIIFKFTQHTRARKIVRPCGYKKWRITPTCRAHCSIKGALQYQALPHQALQYQALQYDALQYTHMQGALQYQA